MPKLDNKLIGTRIMQKRKEKGLNQESLSKQLGISKNHLSNIERGKNVPTVKFIFELCNILGETPDYYLLGVVSTETNELERLAKRLSASEQATLCRLIEAYLNGI